MNAERWALIDSIFQAACDRPPDQQAAFLQTACADDPALLDEVRSLLDCESGAAGVLHSAVGDAFKSALPLASTSGLPRNPFQDTARFTVRGILGAGGFGTVYEVWDGDAETVVALKTLDRAGAAGLDRFKREFRALADIAHPNLVALGELFSEAGEWFFTMERIAGSDFRQWVRGAQDRCDFGRLRDALAQLARGIAALHAAGKLHLDLKPQNVLVTEEGRVVILDFGLMTDARTDTPNGTLVAGTPVYMAPEQFGGLPLNPAADWYAVGIMLYEALTGALPFGGTLRDIVSQKQTREPTPDVLAQNAPCDLVRLCAGMLRTSPGSRPAEEEILAELGIDALDTLNITASEEPFVGRPVEMERLRAALDAARRRFVSVFIQGASGMGKTVLLERFLAEARQRGALVLQGRCYAQERVPYNALDELIDSAGKQLALGAAHHSAAGNLAALRILFPVLADLAPSGAVPASGQTADPHEVRRQAARELRSVFASLAASQPLVLAIDDLHWGSEDSFRLLAEVLRPPGVPGILFLATYRAQEGEANQPFMEWIGAQLTSAFPAPRPALKLELKELDDAEARLLADAWLTRASPRTLPYAAAIAAESGGNPLFVAELARSCSRSQVPGRLPSFDVAVTDRIAALGREAVDFMRLLAIAGEPVELTVARKAARISVSPRLLSELRVKRLIRLRRTGGRLEVESYHDSISRVVAAGLDEPAKALLHGDLAGELENSGRSNLESLAIHYHAAGEDGRAERYALAAADRANRELAFDGAVRMYRLALELDTGRKGSRTIRLKLAEAAGNAGRGPEAGLLYKELADETNGDGALELRRRAVWQYLTSGYIEESLDLVGEVLRAIGMKLPGSPWRAALTGFLWRGWLRLGRVRYRPRDAAQIPAADLVRVDICWSVAQGLAMVDTIRAFPCQAKGMLLALQCGEPYRMSRAWCLEAGYHALRGWRRRRQVEFALYEAQTLAARAGNPHGLALVALARGAAAFLQGRWNDAFGHMSDAEALLRQQCAGAIWEIATAHMMGSTSLFLMGRWQELGERLPQILQAAEARGDRFEVADLRTRLSHALCLAAGRPDQAYAEIEDALARWHRTDFDLQHWWAFMGRIEIDLYAGEPRRAWERVGATWPALRRSFLMRVQYVCIESLHHRARAALALAASDDVMASERRQLLRRAAADAARIERNNTPWGNALAMLLRAGIAFSVGDKPRALELLAEAESALRSTDMFLYAEAARRIRGPLVGGNEGRALVEVADACMREQAIANPERIAAMLAPGFVER